MKILAAGDLGHFPLDDLWFLTSGDLDLCHFHLKIGTPLTRTLENVYTSFDFSAFFRVMSPYGTDGETDGQDA